MNPAEMLVAIVALLVIGGIVRSRFGAHRPDAGTTPGTAADEDTWRLREEVRTLKERVQVLERVITDNRSSIDLDREIDRLRDR